jgi:hypothetical protein
LLGVDDEGYIYVIETKLYRSSERRRALAQALDYASALWSKYSRSPDSFIAELERRQGELEVWELKFGELIINFLVSILTMTTIFCS